jgi:arylsulfatase A-like enzyme
MGAYGCTWVQTPAFDRVAREGLLFNNAYTPNAKCAPSRACVLTGRNSWQLREAANHWCHFPADIKVYPETLAENGYFVGSTAKGWAPGIARDAAGKPRQLAGRPFNARKLEPPTKQISNIDYAGNFEGFLDARPKDQPFCFWYGSTEPHRGFEYGSGVSKGGKNPADVTGVPKAWPDNETIRTDMLDYAFELEHFDRHLGKMLDLLEQRGELDNTIVVVTADNGMAFPRAKGQAYELSNHLPLAIMWKAGIRNPGRAIEDYVSFIDLAPTFLEMAGVKWSDSGMQPATGRSLADIFNAPGGGQVNPQRDHVLIGKERHDIGRPGDVGYPIRGIVKNRLLYIHNFETGRWPAGNPETGYLNCDGGATKTAILEMRNTDQHHFWQQAFGMRPQEELYDLRKDPDCVQNMAQSAEHAEVKKQLQEQLFAELRQQGDPRMLGQGEIFDKYPYADEKGAGFYERYMNGEKMNAGWVNPGDFDKSPTR